MPMIGDRDVAEAWEVTALVASDSRGNFDECRVRIQEEAL